MEYMLHVYLVPIGTPRLAHVKTVTSRLATTLAIFSASIVYLGRSGNRKTAFAVNRANTEIVERAGGTLNSVNVMMTCIIDEKAVVMKVVVVMEVVAVMKVVAMMVMVMLKMTLASRRIVHQARVGMQMHAPVSAVIQPRRRQQQQQLYHHQHQHLPQQQQHRLITSCSMVLPTSQLIAPPEPQPGPANRGMNGIAQAVRARHVAPHHVMRLVDGTPTSVRVSLVLLACCLPQHHHSHHHLLRQPLLLRNYDYYC